MAPLHTQGKSQGQCGGLPGPGLPPQTVVPRGFRCPTTLANLLLLALPGPAAPGPVTSAQIWVRRLCHPLPPKPVPAYFPSAEHLLTLLHMCLPLEGSCQLCTWMAPSPQQPWPVSSQREAARSKPWERSGIPGTATLSWLIAALPWSVPGLVLPSTNPYKQRLFWKPLSEYWGPPELGRNLRENSCLEVTIKKL